MGVDYQLHRVSVDVSKGFRQFQKADNDVYKEEYDAASNHLNKGLGFFSSAYDHAIKAEDDAYVKAGGYLDDGNKELQKSIDEYAAGNLDSAATYYQKAVTKYDDALDLM